MPLFCKPIARFALLWSVLGLYCEATARELVARLGERQTVIPDGKFGFHYFPDEPVGVIGRSPLRFLMVVGNKTVLMEGESFEAAKPVKDVLAPSTDPKAFDGQYAGISSVLLDSTGRELLGFYHAEKSAGGTNREGVHRFYASVGLATSADGGKTFVKVGPVLTGRPEDPAWKGTAQGNADVSVCRDHSGKWLYAYYTEHSRRNPATGKSRSVITCMARCRVEDRGQPGTWKKYFEGSFSEPGLGGKDTEVANCWAPQVTYVPELKKYLMVGSRGGVHLLASDDGIAWQHQGVLFVMDDVPLVDHEIALHPGLHIEKASPSKIEGHLFYAYSPKFGHPQPSSPHYFVKQPVTISLSDVEAGSRTSLANRLKGTRWVNTNKATFEWMPDGRLLHNSNERQWRVLDENRVEITFEPTKKVTLIFDKDLAHFDQPLGDGKKFEGRRTDTVTQAAASNSPSLAERLKGTKWIREGQPNNVFQWTNDGRLLQSGGNRQWKVLDERSVEIRVPTKDGERVDRWVFAEDLKTVLQHGDGGKWKSTWKRID
jgi:hypothetical protein